MRVSHYFFKFVSDVPDLHKLPSARREGQKKEVQGCANSHDALTRTNKSSLIPVAPQPDSKDTYFIPPRIIIVKLILTPHAIIIANNKVYASFQYIGPYKYCKRTQHQRP